MTIPDLILLQLGIQGYTGSIMDRLLAWLKANGGTGFTYNDLMRSMLKAKGFLQPSIVDAWYAYLGFKGYSGSLVDRERAFWLAGGSLVDAPPDTPTIGTSTASYNDVQGNILSVTFTPAGTGAPATSYLATLSTGETQIGTSSPIVFVNNLSNGIARTATIKAVNGSGQSGASAASNSVTPVALLRVASIESRGHNAFETRGVTNIIGRRASITGSGELTDVSLMMQGWIESSGSGYTALGNAYTISEMSLCISGNTPVIVTWGGLPTKTVNPGDTEVISDTITATALMGTATIPRGTTIWCKYIVTLPSGAGVMMSTPATVADFANSQYSFYDPIATTITSTAAVDGIYTFTGTAPQARANGFAPQLLGHYKFGDPKTLMAIGDSIQQGVGDATAKTTGRGWVQNLMVDAGAVTNPYSCLNMAVSGDTAAHFKANVKLLALTKYARIGFESTGTNDLGSAGAGVVATILSDKQAIWTAMKATSIGAAMPILVTYIQPQSTTINPVKTLNSAPNTNWGVGEKSRQINDGLITALGSSNIQYLVDPVQVRQSSDNTQVEYFLWKYNGGTNVYDTLMTTDGTHPTNAGVLLWDASLRTTWDSIN